MRKQKPVSRKKAPPFKRALSATRSLLRTKLQEREACVRILKELNVQIPNLERTCRALEAQLSGATGPDSRPTSQTVGKQVGTVAPKLHLSEIATFTKEQMNEAFPGSTGEIPPEVLAQLPPEDFSQFGSHFGDKPAQSEDFLPPIEGKDVLEKK